MNSSNPSHFPIIATAIWIGICFAALAGPRYDVTDLGSLGGDHPYSLTYFDFAHPSRYDEAASNAIAINNAGTIVGYSYLADNTTRRPFVWQNGALSDAGFSTYGSGAAVGINGSGAVVGGYFFEESGTSGYRQNGDLVTNFGAVGKSVYENSGADYVSYARGINNAGVTVGDNGNGQAFRWSPNGSATLLGDTSHNQTRSIARAINDRDTIVGEAAPNENSEIHAVIFHRGRVVDLQTLPGVNASTARGVNRRGQIVGFFSGVGGSTGEITIYQPYIHAFVYENGRMVDLHPKHKRGESYAVGINRHGQIVGFTARHPDPAYAGLSQNPTPRHRAMLYERDEMIDLNRRIDQNSGWILHEANAINDPGQIVGIGLNPAGLEHAFLLTPRH